MTNKQTYTLDEVDLAGNRYTIHTGSFTHVCEMYSIARQNRPNYVHLISNPDNVDLNWHDGLTEEEQEQLP